MSLNQLVVSILANRAIWPHASRQDIGFEGARKPTFQSEEWRPITEFSEVEVGLSEHQETVLGRWDSHSTGPGRFGNETTVTKSKVVLFSPRRRTTPEDNDDAGIKRAI